jgi:hypothetical protein
MLYLRIMLVTAAIGMLVAGSAHAQMVPGEASPRGQSLLASYDPFAETIEIQFTPGCDATDHTVYYGPLAMVSTYGYTGALCNVGTGGTAILDALPEDSSRTTARWRVRTAPMVPVRNAPRISW